MVDDDEEICVLIENYLSASNYEVITAHDGKEGLALARRLKPFAIILDILMPEMDGWEVLRELKTSGETADIPVIIISVSYDRPTATALGATGYIVLP